MRCGSHSRRPSPHGYCSEHATRYPSALELATESVSSHLARAYRALFSYLVLDFSLEDASIRCFADSSIHFNIVFNLPQVNESSNIHMATEAKTSVVLIDCSELSADEKLALASQI